MPIWEDGTEHASIFDTSDRYSLKELRRIAQHDGDDPDSWCERGKYALCTEALGDPHQRQIPAESLLMITDVAPGPVGKRTVFVAYVTPDLKDMATIPTSEMLLRPTRPVVVAPTMK